jgi:hypothetical protein
MKINSKKSLIITGVLVALAAVGILNFNLANSHAAGNAISVTSSDLTKAGFTQVKAAKSASGRFSGPALYFTVSDKATSASSEAPNIVMVSDLALPYAPATTALFKYGADSHSFTLANAAGQEATLADGRIAINFIKGSNYVVIIGPNQAKLETLATNLAGKIQ